MTKADLKRLDFLKTVETNRIDCVGDGGVGGLGLDGHGLRLDSLRASSEPSGDQGLRGVQDSGVVAVLEPGPDGASSDGKGQPAIETLKRRKKQNLAKFGCKEKSLKVGSLERPSVRQISVSCLQELGSLPCT